MLYSFWSYFNEKRSIGYRLPIKLGSPNLTTRKLYAKLPSHQSIKAVTLINFVSCAVSCLAGNNLHVNRCNEVSLEMARLPGPIRIPCHLSGYWYLPFTDRRSTKDDRWVHNGQSTTQGDSDSHFVLRWLLFSHWGTWIDRRDVQLRCSVYGLFDHNSNDFCVDCRTIHCSVALPTEIGQRLWSRFQLRLLSYP